MPVDGYDAGIRRVVDRSSNVFFADRSILLDAAMRSPSASDLTVLDRMFTYGPLALALTVSRVANGGCTPLTGALVDLWHCDARGVYSESAEFAVPWEPFVSNG